MKGAIDAGCFPSGQHYPGIAHLLRVAATGLAEEFTASTKIEDLPIVSLDTETTGRDALKDRVVEVAAVIWHQGEVKSRNSWLIHPDCPIPAEVTAVHGITDEAVKDCPRFAEVAKQIADTIAGHVPLAYNAEFDRKFLTEEFARAGIDLGRAPPTLRRGVEWLDPLVWAREIQKYEKSKALGEVCQRLGIALTNAHRATDDSEAALHVLLAFMPDVRVPKTYGAFVQEQRRLARLQEEERARWRSSRGG
jgi:DNA polymerase III subunit epsilon